jgi:AraC-like DNA-binding protein
MTATSRKNGSDAPSSERAGGLFRAVLAGPGRSLSDAFANLEKATNVQTVTRHLQRGLLGARIELTQEEGEGYWELTQIGDDVYVIVENFAYKDPRVELVPGDGLIQFYFKLTGDLTMGVSRTEPLRLNRPSLLVYNQPPGMNIQEWTAPSARERCVAITVRSKYLVENFFNSSVDAPGHLNGLIAGSPGQIQYCQLPLSPQMFELATRLVDNPFTGKIGLIHTEALTLELLCLAVAGLNVLPDAPRERYGEHALRRLHLARQLLMKQLSPAPTIRQVARATGINETELKRGFKAVFGETIFDFSVRCRMQHAMMLLRERRVSVARVAEAVGYSHPTSFATAFRRQFGVCPKDARPAAAN